MKTKLTKKEIPKCKWKIMLEDLISQNPVLKEKISTYKDRTLFVACYECSGYDKACGLYEPYKKRE